ncbi:MAG TPA: LamG domain-containing protein [Bryobacteraceae bacterium]
MKRISLLSMVLCAQAFGANVVGLWHLDENSGQMVLDSSSFGNNGQLGSTTGADANDPSWTAGKFGSGLHFNGTSNYVQVPSSASLSVTGSITVESWIKLDSYGAVSNDAPVIAKWNDIGGDARSYALSVYFDRIRFDVSHDGKFLGGPCTVNAGSGGLQYACVHSAIAISAVSIPLGKWTHVAGVFDSSTKKLQVFINGAPDISVIAENSTVFANSEPLLMGAADFGGGSRLFLHGAMDEARVWQRALSPAEVLSSAQAGLRGLWHFNTDGTDSSGMGNDAFVNGATFTTNAKLGGGALSVDGTDDYAAVGGNLSLDITGPITVEAWVNLKALPLGNVTFAPIAAKWSDAGNDQLRSYALAITPDGSVRFDVSHTGHFSCGSFNNFGPFSCASADSALVISNQKIALNAWYHIAGVFDGHTLQVFVNGVPDKSIATVGSTIFTSTLPIAFGFANEGHIASQFTNGAIDEVQIWARPLSAAEIAFQASPATSAELLVPGEIDQAGLQNNGGGNGSGVVAESDFQAGSTKQVMLLEFLVPDAAGAQITSVKGHVSNGNGASLLGWVPGNSGLDAFLTGMTVNPPVLNVDVNLSDKSKLGVTFEWNNH